VCQEGWDGARRHPQPAAGVQSAEQWCSSQSQPQPQLRYQQWGCFAVCFKLKYVFCVCVFL